MAAGQRYETERDGTRGLFRRAPVRSLEFQGDGLEGNY